MSRVVAIEHVSLDGVYQAPARADEDRRGGFAHGGWAMPGNAPEMQPFLGARMGAEWSLLVGRVTYEDLAGFWPKQPSNPIADALNAARKFVVSNTLAEPLSWRGSSVLRGDAADAVARLKAEHANTLVIFGSGMLVASLLSRDLVDELVLQIHPIVLGNGRRLFDSVDAAARFTLAESAITSTGVVLAAYESASQPPSPGPDGTAAR